MVLIEIKWDKTTRGYDFCAPTEDIITLTKWYTNEVDISFSRVENGMEYYSVTITNPEKHDFEFISINIQFYDPSETQLLGTVYRKIEDANFDEMNFEIAIKENPYENFIYSTYKLGRLKVK